MEIRARNWFITINADILPSDVEICRKMDEIKAKNYAYITHNKDAQKRPHIHLLVEFENARAFNTLQKKFQTWHIEKCENEIKVIQYLTHLNNPEKEQYEIEDIKTNNIDWVTRCYEMQNDYIDDDKQLRYDILTKKYETMYDLLVCDDYSLLYLQKRKGVIEELFRGLKERERREKMKQ